MRKLLLLACLLLMLPAVASAQATWKYAGTFPSDTLKGLDGNALHGIAVDPDGKVWIQPYGRTDSIFVAETNKWERTTVLYIYDKDGKPASFSPLKVIDFGGGKKDTLGGYLKPNKTWDWKTGRGLATSGDGHILVSQWYWLYKIDYKTGKGLAKAEVAAGGSKTAAASDKDGNVFLAHVVGGNPILMYDKNLNFLGNAVDKTTGFSRSFEVSPDGNTIYWSGYTTHAIVMYRRPDAFSPFDSLGVVIPGVDSESLTMNPKTGRLWVSAGSPNDKPNRYPDVKTYWSEKTWYAFDPADLKVNTIPVAKDSIKWQDDGKAGRPRGIDFSPDGNTAYVVQFSQPVPAVQKFTRSGGTAIERTTDEVPTAFTLEQNFPNPFNPTTQIAFALKMSGHVSLKVYDPLGREVAVLLDETMTPGEYRADFDASNLPSGTYLYVLSSQGQRMSRTMVLLK